MKTSNTGEVKNMPKAILELLDDSPFETFHIIETDNFGGDYPNESFLTKTNSDGEYVKVSCHLAEAKELCNTLNKVLHPDLKSPRCYLVVPSKYTLQSGFEM